jgi:hypothetical protein
MCGVPSGVMMRGTFLSAADSFLAEAEARAFITAAFCWTGFTFDLTLGALTTIFFAESVLFKERVLATATSILGGTAVSRRGLCKAYPLTSRVDGLADFALAGLSFEIGGGGVLIIAGLVS